MELCHLRRSNIVCSYILSQQQPSYCLKLESSYIWYQMLRWLRPDLAILCRLKSRLFDTCPPSVLSPWQSQVWRQHHHIADSSGQRPTPSRRKDSHFGVDPRRRRCIWNILELENKRRNLPSKLTWNTHSMNEVLHFHGIYDFECRSTSPQISYQFQREDYPFQNIYREMTPPLIWN